MEMGRGEQNGQCPPTMRERAIMVYVRKWKGATHTGNRWLPLNGEAAGNSEEVKRQEENNNMKEQLKYCKKQNVPMSQEKKYKGILLTVNTTIIIFNQNISYRVKPSRKKRNIFQKVLLLW